MTLIRRGVKSILPMALGDRAKTGLPIALSRRTKRSVINLKALPLIS